MLEDKAKDLGRSIGQSEEYKAVKRSSEALSNDREAATLLRQMEQIRQEAQALLQQVQGNAAYQRAVAAQENFDKLMLRVNQWIGDGIRAGATSPIILA